MENAKEIYVQRNGVRIFAQTIGEGEPLLLLMGLGANGEKWQANVDVYKRYFQCVLVDNRGAGRSDKPEVEAYSVADMAEDAVAVLDALGIQKAHINGISMGGAIAQEIAIRYPQRVRSLILTSTFCYVTPAFRTVLEFLRDQTGVLEPGVLKRLNQWMTFGQVTQNQRPEFLTEMARQDRLIPYPMPAYAYKAQCNACMAHEARQRLKDIQAPTLIAAGKRDLFVAQEVTQALHRGIAGSRLYLSPEGGHVHQWEYLDAYNAVTLGFLLSHREG